MPFAFLAPLALAALGLVAAPIVIHMLRRSKSKRLDFPDLRFLRETPSLVRRLTPPNRRWLLALRVLVIALIALAAARPALTGGAADAATATVVLIDGSASMSKPEAREAARVAAAGAIGRLAENDLVSVAQFDRRVTWIARHATRDEAIAALEAYAPGLAAADPTAAIAAAERSLTAVPSEGRRIVLISDFQSSNGPWTSTGSISTADIEPIRIENGFANAYVSDSSVETTKDGERLACSVVRAGVDDRHVERLTLPLAEGAATEGVLVSRDGVKWQARVTAPDGFDFDDVRFGVVDTIGPIVVCDPGAGAPYLAAAARVVAGDPAVSVVPRLDPESLAGASIAIVSSRALEVGGATTALESWIWSGGAALVFAAAPVTASDVIPGVGSISSADTPVSLAGAPGSPAVVTLRASRLRVGPVDAAPGDDVLARDGDGRPVVVRRTVSSGRVTVAGFDTVPAAGRLVLDGGFPDVIRTLAGGPRLERPSVGDSLAGLSADTIVEIDGRRIPVEPDGSVLFDAPGLVRVSTPGGERWIAVNVPPAESEPGQLSGGEVVAMAHPARASDVAPAAALAASEQRWPLWRILLALSLLAAIAELATVSIRKPSSIPPPATADEDAATA